MLRETGDVYIVQEAAFLASAAFIEQLFKACEVLCVLHVLVQACRALEAVKSSRQGRYTIANVILIFLSVHSAIKRLLLGWIEQGITRYADLQAVNRGYWLIHFDIWSIFAPQTTWLFLQVVRALKLFDFHQRIFAWLEPQSVKISGSWDGSDTLVTLALLAKHTHLIADPQGWTVATRLVLITACIFLIWCYLSNINLLIKYLDLLLRLLYILFLSTVLDQVNLYHAWRFRLVLFDLRRFIVDLAFKISDNCWLIVEFGAIVGDGTVFGLLSIGLGLIQYCKSWQLFGSISANSLRMGTHWLLHQTIVLRWVLIRRSPHLIDLFGHEVFDLTLLHHQTPSALLLLHDLFATCEGKLRLHVEGTRCISRRSTLFWLFDDDIENLVSVLILWIVMFCSTALILVSFIVVEAFVLIAILRLDVLDVRGEKLNFSALLWRESALFAAMAPTVTICPFHCHHWTICVQMFWELEESLRQLFGIYGLIFTVITRCNLVLFVWLILMLIILCLNLIDLLKLPPILMMHRQFNLNFIAVLWFFIIFLEIDWNILGTRFFIHAFHLLQVILLCLTILFPILSRVWNSMTIDLIHRDVGEGILGLLRCTIRIFFLLWASYLLSHFSLIGDLIYFFCAVSLLILKLMRASIIIVDLNCLVFVQRTVFKILNVLDLNRCIFIFQFWCSMLQIWIFCALFH